MEEIRDMITNIAEFTRDKPSIINKATVQENRKQKLLKA